MSRSKAYRIDRAVERQGKIKGSYRRRLNDAFEAFHSLKVEQLSPEIAFVFYLFACEKVAKVMVGINKGKKGPRPNFRDTSIHPTEVVRAANNLGCNSVISEDEIKLIFTKNQTKDRFCAYSIRTRLFHDFGPTHLNEVREHAPKLNRAMKRFLDCKECLISSSL